MTVAQLIKLLQELEPNDEVITIDRSGCEYYGDWNGIEVPIESCAASHSINGAGKVIIS